GADADVVAELRRYTDLEPLRENGWRLLATAHYLAGNGAAALDTYGRARAVLAEQLGAEPGPELRALHAAILRQDDGAVRGGLALPAPPRSERSTPEPDRPDAPPPRRSRPPDQLPAGANDFTGRAKELTDLDALLANLDEAPAVATIA